MISLATDARLARIPGFYPTPPSVVAMLLERAAPWQRGHLVLEPSAGRGDIADRLRERVDRLVVVEPEPVLVEVLRQNGHAPVACRFEDFEAAEQFDKVVMNPPFAQGLDMLHVQRAFGMLAAGGLLVALLNDGSAPGDGTQPQREAFAAWLMSHRAIHEVHVERLDPQWFLTPENFRPSTVPIKLLVLRKRSGSRSD